VLSSDGIVALENVLLEWVPPVAELVRVVVDEIMMAVIAVPFREADAPASSIGTKSAEGSTVGTTLNGR